VSGMDRTAAKKTQERVDVGGVDVCMKCEHHFYRAACAQAIRASLTSAQVHVRACMCVCGREGGRQGGREGYKGRRQEYTGFECLLKRTHVLVHLVTSRLSRRHADLAPSIWGTRGAEAQLGHVVCVLVVSAEHARAQMHVQASESNAQHNQNPPPQQHTTTTRGMRKKKCKRRHELVCATRRRGANGKGDDDATHYATRGMRHIFAITKGHCHTRTPSPPVHVRKSRRRSTSSNFLGNVTNSGDACPRLSSGGCKGQVSDAYVPFLRAISSVQRDGAQHSTRGKGRRRRRRRRPWRRTKGTRATKIFFWATIRTIRGLQGWRGRCLAGRLGAQRRVRAGVGRVAESDWARACRRSVGAIEVEVGGTYSLGGKAANWLCAWVGRSAVGTGF
jgi:hypothetical protein